MKEFFKRYWLFIIAIIYIIIPTDLIPDLIPFFGGLDDSALVILSVVIQYLDYRRTHKDGV